MGILVALRERDRGEGGALVESALFETAAFLMGQFMASSAITGQPAPPMPARVSAWAVYELFETAEGGRVFIGITSDHHWESFCREFNRPGLFADASLATNEARVEARHRLIPELVALFKALPASEIERRCLGANLPFALIARPEDLLDDPQLNANGSLADTVLPGGIAAQETFDPKIYAPIEYRGPLGSIPTKLPGVHFSEFLKNTAGIADKLAVVRSMTHGEAAHERGAHNMFTGYRPSPVVTYPSFGSVVSHELGPRVSDPRAH